MIYIGTTRYNSETFEQKTNWLKRKKWNGCVYGLNKKLPKTLPAYEWCYVIEMINDKNEIGGIGYIKNEFCPENRSRVYREDHYNMYVYKGEKFIGREELLKKNNCLAIIQPLGSKNDKIIIDFANQNKIPLYFTKNRVFKH